VALAAAALSLQLASPSPVGAGDLVGLRVGFYTSVEEPFVGFELLLPIGGRVYLNPNVEYVFLEDPTYLTFNADFHYDFPTRGRTYAWAGAGLGVLYANPEGPAGSSSDLGLNLIFGVGFKGDVVPYFQAKLIFSDDTEFVLGFGLRF
jgi:hypothetical protein